MKFWLTTLLVCLAASAAHADSYEEHDYILNCSGCHRMDGSGSATVPSLHNMAELAHRAGARAYFIRVPGVAQAPISDARLAALMNWLMKRFTGRAPNPPYKAEEVSELRKKPYLDPLAERSRLLSR